MCYAPTMHRDSCMEGKSIVHCACVALPLVGHAGAPVPVKIHQPKTFLEKQDSFLQLKQEEQAQDGAFQDAEEARLEAENDKFMDEALNGPDAESSLQNQDPSFIQLDADNDDDDDAAAAELA